MSDFIEEDDLEINVLYLLNTYADGNTRFKSKFLDGVDAYFTRERRITSSQFEALKDMYYQIFEERFKNE